MSSRLYLRQHASDAAMVNAAVDAHNINSLRLVCGLEGVRDRFSKTIEGLAKLNACPIKLGVGGLWSRRRHNDGRRDGDRRAQFVGQRFLNRFVDVLRHTESSMVGRTAMVDGDRLGGNSGPVNRS